MDVGYMTNAWGVCAGHPSGVGSIKDLFYISTGSTEEAVVAIGQAGFNKIEIFDGNLFEYRDRKDEFNSMLAQNNITLTAVFTAANFIYDDILEDEFYKLERAINVAGEFSAKYMNVGGGPLRFDGPREDDLKKLADRLNRFAELCAKYGLIPSFHHQLNSLVEKENEIDDLMQLCDINLCLDTAYIYAAGGDPASVIKKHIDRIKYVHIKDFGHGYEPLGKGGVDFNSVFEELLPRGSDIQITVEANGICMDLLELAKHNYSFIKRYF